MAESKSLTPAEIIRIIMSDEKLKKKLIEALSDSIATKKDILTVLTEIKKLREDHNKDVKTILEKMDSFHKEYLDERERIWSEIERVRKENIEQLNRVWRAIDALREETKALREETKALREEMKTLREDFNRETKNLWSAVRGLQEEMKGMREDFSRETKNLWNAVRGLQEEMKALREDFNKLSLKIDALGARWGIMSEIAFREGLRGILERRLTVKVTRWEEYDEEGLVYQEPAIIEIDVVIKNKEHTLIEIKSHVSKSDVATFLRKAEFYEKKTGVKPRLVMITPFIDTKAKEFAYRHKIKVYGSSYEDIEL